eukprot:scaffold7420_cov97-Isochrysis_galbana.AAC.10
MRPGQAWCAQPPPHTASRSAHDCTPWPHGNKCTGRHGRQPNRRRGNPPPQPLPACQSTLPPHPHPP